MSVGAGVARSSDLGGVREALGPGPRRRNRQDGQHCHARNEAKTGRRPGDRPPPARSAALPVSSIPSHERPPAPLAKPKYSQREKWCNGSGKGDGCWEPERRVFWAIAVSAHRTHLHDSSSSNKSAPRGLKRSPHRCRGRTYRSPASTQDLEDSKPNVFTTWQSRGEAATRRTPARARTG